MFRFIKWTFIVLLIMMISYAWNFFANLNKEQSQVLTKGAMDTLEGGSITVFITPVAQMMKTDLAEKKSHFLERLRVRVKKTLSDVLDGDDKKIPKEEPSNLQ